MIVNLLNQNCPNIFYFEKNSSVSLSCMMYKAMTSAQWCLLRSNSAVLICTGTDRFVSKANLALAMAWPQARGNNSNRNNRQGELQYLDLIHIQAAWLGCPRMGIGCSTTARHWPHLLLSHHIPDLPQNASSPILPTYTQTPVLSTLIGVKLPIQIGAECEFSLCRLAHIPSTAQQRMRRHKHTLQPICNPTSLSECSIRIAV